MILLLLGAPGTGKTTVCQTLTAQYGVPHFEMSWMPEFLRMNGQDIPYAQDEQIAVGALLAVAKVYTEAGHRVVV
ncbi:MAG TPA: AAA family ATPase, partial [Anaerolineales bacterium]|nr:AAA family ATPase [Anaerolineales bacterium]